MTRNTRRLGCIRASTLRTFVLVLAVLRPGTLPAQVAHDSSPLSFKTSAPALQASFDWAKRQALLYSHPASSTVGAWYEAALPGRDAFCMRDVSHQAEGAAALGLNAANRRMLHLFAESIAPSRDWAGYWEIDAAGHPSSADYVSDDDFWYNLPANFDLLSASVRLWRWTGDPAYQGPEFQHFRQITMHDFAERWLLTPGTILYRPRLVNQRRQTGKFVEARGIPSYTEETKDFIFGTDQLAAQIAAARALSQIATQTGDARTAAALDRSGQQWQAELERVGWSAQEHHYLRTIGPKLTGRGAGDVMVLYFGAAGSPLHRQAALDSIATPQYWQHTNIEEESYIPLTLFRYGRANAAYQVLADLSRPDKPRREYPENSFAVLEAIVSGVMGAEAPLPGEPYDLLSVSQLPEQQTAELSSLTIRGHLVDLAHRGTSWSRLTNVSGPDLVWRAAFPGSPATLRVNGRSQRARRGTTADGLPYGWIEISVPAGKTVAVSKE